MSPEELEQLEREQRYRPMNRFHIPGYTWPAPTFADKRAIVRARQERERLTAAGYRCHETDWEIIRGGRADERILDAVISSDGRHVWTKIGTPE